MQSPGEGSGLGELLLCGPLEHEMYKIYRKK